MSLGFLEIRRLAEQLLEMRLNGKHFLAFCMHIWDIVLALFIFTNHKIHIRSPIKTISVAHLSLMYPLARYINYGIIT
jgi:hypothetical protein